MMCRAGTNCFNFTIHPDTVKPVKVFDEIFFSKPKVLD